MKCFMFHVLVCAMCHVISKTEIVCYTGERVYIVTVAKLDEYQHRECYFYVVVLFILFFYFLVVLHTFFFFLYYMPLTHIVNEFNDFELNRIVCADG